MLTVWDVMPAIAIAAGIAAVASIVGYRINRNRRRREVARAASRRRFER